MESARDDAGDAREQRARRLEHEIVGVVSGMRRPRPADGQLELATRRQSQPVA